MQLIDGKATANDIKKEIAKEVEQIKALGGKTPHLAAILVGHDHGVQRSKVDSRTDVTEELLNLSFHK